MQTLPFRGAGLLRGFLVLLVTVLAVAVTVPAQETRGAIRGRVVDASGAVIPNAAVGATNVATNVTVSTMSNADGNSSRRCRLCAGSTWKRWRGGKAIWGLASAHRASRPRQRPSHPVAEAGRGSMRASMNSPIARDIPLDGTCGTPPPPRKFETGTGASHRENGGSKASTRTLRLPKTIVPQPRPAQNLREVGGCITDLGKSAPVVRSLTVAALYSLPTRDARNRAATARQRLVSLTRGNPQIG